MGAPRTFPHRSGPCRSVADLVFLTCCPVLRLLAFSVCSKEGPGNVKYVKTRRTFLDVGFDFLSERTFSFPTSHKVVVRRLNTVETEVTRRTVESRRRGRQSEILLSKVQSRGNLCSSVISLHW